MINLSIDESNLENSFDRIATDLFNNFALQIGPFSYQITEVECYYNSFSSNKSFDIFAHKHDKSYLDGTWRLHGAGLDIVLKKEDDYYGGILIRGIQQLDSNNNPIEGIIDGPWNTASLCFKNKKVFSPQNNFYLKAWKANQERSFKKSPRVGLFLKNSEDLEYICKPWRYNTSPINTKNYRYLIFLQLWLLGDADKNLIVPNKNSQNSYISAFEEGLNMEAKDFVGLKNNVANRCKLFGCYTHKYTKYEINVHRT